MLLFPQERWTAFMAMTWRVWWLSANTCVALPLVRGWAVCVAMATVSDTPSLCCLSPFPPSSSSLLPPAPLPPSLPPSLPLNLKTSLSDVSWRHCPHHMTISQQVVMSYYHPTNQTPVPQRQSDHVPPQLTLLLPSPLTLHTLPRN